MSQAKLLLITPPFTQLYTPYPATTYIKGYLNTLGIPSFQADLRVEVILHLFSKERLKQIFAQAKKQRNRSMAEPYIDWSDAFSALSKNHL